MHLESENEELQKKIDDYWKVDDEIGGFVSGKFPDIASHLRECFADKERMRKLYLERNKENMELSKKSNAKSDIIRNMFDFITEDPEEVQEGFTFKRDWGNKYIDEWNKIVTDEFKEVIKDINEQSPDDEMEWKTDGYDFSLHIREEEEEEEVQGSKVDMEAFKKLKEDGMMPWAK